MVRHIPRRQQLLRSLNSTVERRRQQLGEHGMTTAEYAVGTVAACGFGGVLYKVIESPSVTRAITALFTKALTFLF